MDKSAKAIVRYGVISLLVVLIGLGLYASFFTDALSVESIRSFVDGFGVLAPVAYGVIYFVAVMLLIPSTIFTILAGTLFGKFWGTVIVVVSATLAASVAFLITQFAGQGLQKRISEHPKIAKWQDKVDKLIGENGFVSFFIMRCLFLHYMFMSYASGLVKGARFRDFALATFVTNVIFSFMFVYLGDSLMDGPKALILPVILIVIALQVPRLIKKFNKKYADVQ